MHKFVKLILSYSAAAIALALCGAFVLTVWLSFSVKPLLVNRLGGSQAVYDSQGELLRLSLSTDQKYRLWKNLDEISPSLVQSTLLYEDRHFYAHWGVNPLSLARAALTTFVIGHKRVGGSTITMQLARLRFSLRTRTVTGKLLQILHALQLEWHYSKREILESYLNLAPYGGNIEGVGAASIILFGKGVDKLETSEAMTLAVIPQDPAERALKFMKSEERTPIRAVPQETYQARLRLYGLWAAEFGKDEIIELAIGSQKSQTSMPQKTSVGRIPLPFEAPHTVDYVLQVDNESTTIETTLSGQLQRQIEDTTARYIARHSEIGIRNAAVILIDYRDMEVKALLGSVDYFGRTIQGQVDGTRAKRSPGSALKPFIYALALDQGLIHPRTMLKDAPIRFAAYDPENFDKQYLGPIDATSALIRSRNIPAITLENQLRDDGLWGLLHRAGVSNLRLRSYYGLALALGGVELTLRELVQLYAMLANRGLYRELIFTRGNKVRGIESEGHSERLLSEGASFLTLEMLRDNPRPEDEEVNSRERAHSPVAWKTGTSFGFRDAWSLGVFGQYVLGVWIGAFDGKGNPAYVGRASAGPLFFSIVDVIRSSGEYREPHRAVPAQVRHVSVCAVSGEIPTPFCPTQRDTWFIPGRSPILACELHRDVVIDPSSQLRACPGEPGEHRVYEFWPSDLLALFRAAGIPRRSAPPWKPECCVESGLPPQIVSPQRGISYQVRLSRLHTNLLEGSKLAADQEGGLVTDESIPFRVVVDADVATVHWFVNDRLVAKARSGETFWWSPSPGKFVVRAVDDQGRNDARDLVVELAE